MSHRYQASLPYWAGKCKDSLLLHRLSRRSSQGSLMQDFSSYIWLIGSKRCQKKTWYTGTDAVRWRMIQHSSLRQSLFRRDMKMNRKKKLRGLSAMMMKLRFRQPNMDCTRWNWYFFQKVINREFHSLSLTLESTVKMIDSDKKPSNLLSAWDHYLSIKLW
jgi:hypothetical protein